MVIYSIYLGIHIGHVHHEFLAAPGEFVVWDLEKRRMHHLREAHRGPITSAQFLPKEPLLWLGGQ